MRKIKKNSILSEALTKVETILTEQDVAISSMSGEVATFENDFDCGPDKCSPGQYVIVDVKAVLRVIP